VEDGISPDDMRRGYFGRKGEENLPGSLSDTTLTTPNNEMGAKR